MSDHDDDRLDRVIGFVLFGLGGLGLIAIGVVGVIREWTDATGGLLLIVAGSALAMFGMGKAQDHI